jgi:hypothetical protein
MIPFFLFQDLLTINGYTKIFESCENISDVLDKLQSLNGNFGIGYLIEVLRKKNYFQVIQSIYSYCEEIRSKMQFMKSDGYSQVIETFSLLENVFRNALLRPYIPAYRTINKNCGRYRCYIDSNAEHLFTTLGFENMSDNLLTYTETDLFKTVIYALTCACFWSHYTRKLNDYNASQNPSAQRKTTH